MALKNHKKTITRIFILLVVMTLICMGVFACTNYLEQQSKAFVDMSKVQLIQLDEPESDAPAMKITTTAGRTVSGTGTGVCKAVHRTGRIRLL